MFINICKGCKLMYNLHKKRICTSLSVWKKLFGIYFKSTKELKIQILHRIVLASFFSSNKANQRFCSYKGNFEMSVVTNLQIYTLIF